MIRQVGAGGMDGVPRVAHGFRMAVDEYDVAAACMAVANPAAVTDAMRGETCVNGKECAVEWIERATAPNSTCGICEDDQLRRGACEARAQRLKFCLIRC